MFRRDQSASAFVETASGFNVASWSNVTLEGLESQKLQSIDCHEASDPELRRNEGIDDVLRVEGSVNERWFRQWI